MKRRISLLLCVILVLGSFAGCGSQNVEGEAASGGEVVDFKIVNCATPSDPVHIAQEFLLEDIEKKSGGRIKAEIFGNKSVSSSDETNVDMVVNGEMHFCTTPTFMIPTLNGDLTAWNIYGAPYLFMNDEELYAYSESDLGVAMREELQNSLPLIGYPITPLGWCKISNSKHQINTLKDFKGLKIRTSMSDAYIKTMEALGANPTPLAWGEVFTAIQQGTVDGLMTSTMLIYTEKFYEAQKYLSCIDPFTIPHMPILNKDWYEALPEDLKPVVDECMIDFVAKFRELNEAADIEAISLLADGGLEVKQYSGSEKQEFANACAPLWTSFPDTFGGKEVVDDAIAFIEEYRASK